MRTVQILDEFQGDQLTECDGWLLIEFADFYAYITPV
jgi:hypothetical protein